MIHGMDTKRFNKLLTLLTSIASFIVGIFLKEWLEIIFASLFSTQTRVTLTGFVIMMLLNAITLITILFFAKQAEDREHRWLQIEDRLGIPAEIEFEPIDIGTGKFYKRLADYIRKTGPGDEIVVIAHYRPRGGEESSRETEQYRQARQEYSQTLIEKAREPGITYRRIICFDESPEQIKIAVPHVKQWMIEHAKQMLELKKIKPGKITLKKGRALFDPDILVIKDKLAVISLDIRDAEGHIHTDGVLIFHNPPNGDIIQQLYELFMMADNKSLPVEEIPEI
jgi:hypothetical protein